LILPFSFFKLRLVLETKEAHFLGVSRQKKKTLLEGSPALTMSFLRFQFLKVHWLVVTAVVAGGHRYFQEAAVKNQTLQQDVGQTPEVSSSSLYSSLA
jgi:hypothetical protein